MKKNSGWLLKSNRLLYMESDGEVINTLQHLIEVVTRDVVIFVVHFHELKRSR